jgi:subtilisin family serine protease
LKASRVAPGARRHRRGLWLVAGLVGALGIASVAAAGTPKPVPGGAVHNLQPVVAPFGLGKRPTTVVVQLAGDPVVLADANHKDQTGSPLSSDQKQQIRNQLKAQQAPVAQQIQSDGGQVLATYQAAYNGIKLRIASNKVASLGDIAGVTAVHPVPIYKPTNVHSVPFVGAPQAWDGTAGFHGEGIKVAVIDTGIDYTHADFGGPGTAAAYQHALGLDTSDPTSTNVCMTPQLTPCFGPNAPKVKGGVDLVGDDYNADPNDPAYQPIPHPDPNPLDCNGHGTHVAGTATGFGVLDSGSTYTGPYNASTVSGNSWLVGPGVAPKADLYSIRVFGCQGSTDVVVDAIEWAVDHNMDVINMSLGSDFGRSNSPDAVAATNASKDGVIVVSSSGNAGSNPYMAGTPGVAENTLAVAALDANQTFPGASMKLSTGPTLTAINANGATFADGTTLPVKVLKTSSGAISLGCDPAEYTAAGVTGDIVVTKRGTCARVARAIFGQQAGAAAVIMVNTDPGLPPFEGPITNNPDTGQPFHVTIPFFGVSSNDGPALLAADGGTITLTNTQLSNPGFDRLASFTSFGPRSGDSAIKPDITAPGVSIASAGMGTGNGPAIISGTSQASPHVAGSAALVKQAHPDWRKVAYWNAALVDTASPSGVANYSVRGAGAGLLQVQNAVKTQVIGLADKNAAELNFGFAELNRDFNQRQHLTLKNFGSSPATFTVADTLDSGSPHTVSFNNSTVTVPARGERDVVVALSVPVATAGDATAFRDVAGVLSLTPSGGSNSGVALHVPYYLVPQAVSNVQVSGIDSGSLRQGSAQAKVTNNHGAAVGFADWFAWGLKDRKQHGLSSDDLLAAGVQSYPSDGLLVFAISTARRWANPSEVEFDVLVDTTGDGTPDYDVVAADFGQLTSGTNNGQDAVAVFNLATGAGDIEFLAGAFTDGTSMELPVLFSQLGLTSSSTKISYTVNAFGLTDGTADSFGGDTASYDVNHPAFTSSNPFETVNPGETKVDTITVDKPLWQAVQPLGLLVLAQNNQSDRGKDEGQTFNVNIR